MKVKVLIPLVYCESVIQAVAKPGFLKVGGGGGQVRQRPSGVWGQSLQPPEARWSGSRAPSNGKFLQFFNKNNAFLCIFRPKEVVLNQ